MLSKMLKLATEQHYGQKDRAGVDYIFHCVAVAGLVIKNYGHKDEELVCIAIGHDLLEDTNISESTLFFEFGERVTEGIKALTKWEGQTYAEYKEAIFSNEDAMRVKFCDLTHNMDLSRLNNVTEKDVLRVDKYDAFREEIRDKLLELEAQTLMVI